MSREKTLVKKGSDFFAPLTYFPLNGGPTKWKPYYRKGGETWLPLTSFPLDFFVPPLSPFAPRSTTVSSAVEDRY